MKGKSSPSDKRPTLIWGFSKNEAQDIESPTIPYLRVTSFSFPSYDSKKLVPFHARKKFESENCLWGSGTQGCRQCFRCKEGYISYYGFCRREEKIAESYKNGLKKVKGCLVIRDNKGKCEFCDGWNGWYMHREGECRKWRFGKDKIGSLDLKGAYDACKKRLLRGMSDMMVGYGIFAG